MTRVAIMLVAAALLSWGEMRACATGREASGCAARNQLFASYLKEAQKAEHQAAAHEISAEQSEKVWAESATKALAVVDDAVRQELESNAEPKELEETIHCIESPYTIQWSQSATNTPLVIPYPGRSTRAFVVAFLLLRGNGETLPSLELWRFAQGKWICVSSLGQDYKDSTFVASQISAGTPDRQWLLIYGKRMGETALRLELIENDGSALGRLWRSPPFERAVITSINGEYLSLKQYEKDDPTQKQTVYQIDKYLIDSPGLKLASSSAVTEPWFPK